MGWTHRIGVLWFCAVPLLLPGSSCKQEMPGLREHARIADPQIVESSGITVSRRFDDVFWTHNDDGPAALFAVGLDGKSIRSYDLPVPHYDWEDISNDNRGNLYLLDNTSEDDDQNRSLIHVFPEPDPFIDRDVLSVKTFEISYEDVGRDTEALFVWKDQVFLVTKPWDGTKPRVYVADNMRDSVASFVGTISETAMVTGGDVSEDGRLVVLSSYRALFIFESAGDPKEGLLGEPLICPLNAGQIEGVSWRGTDLILTNEQGAIFWVKESEWRVHEAPRKAYPTVQVPRYDPRPLEDRLPLNWDQGIWLSGDDLEKMGRIAWSENGLHVGIRVPEGLEIPPLDGGRREDFDHWFLPGRVYVLINPRGDRRLAFGSDDGCIVVGSQGGRAMTCEVRSLLPATYIQSVKTAPPWIRVEQNGRWILVTLTPEGPGLEQMRAGQSMGFNLVIVGETGRILSWAPLTLQFSWDAPSFWGLIELVE